MIGTMDRSLLRDFATAILESQLISHLDALDLGTSRKP